MAGQKLRLYQGSFKAAAYGGIGLGKVTAVSGRSLRWWHMAAYGAIAAYMQTSWWLGKVMAVFGFLSRWRHMAAYGAIAAYRQLL